MATTFLAFRGCCARSACRVTPTPAKHPWIFSGHWGCGASSGGAWTCHTPSSSSPTPCMSSSQHGTSAPQRSLKTFLAGTGARRLPRALQGECCTWSRERTPTCWWRTSRWWCGRSASSTACPPSASCWRRSPGLGSSTCRN